MTPRPKTEAEKMIERIQNQPKEHILEPIRRAIYNAKRDTRRIVKIHLTHDFYMRVRAQTLDFGVITPEKLLGYEYECHKDKKNDSEWWLELAVDGVPLPDFPDHPDFPRVS